MVTLYHPSVGVQRSGTPAVVVRNPAEAVATRPAAVVPRSPSRLLPTPASSPSDQVTALLAFLKPVPPPFVAPGFPLYKLHEYGGKKGLERAANVHHMYLSLKPMLQREDAEFRKFMEADVEHKRKRAAEEEREAAVMRKRLRTGGVAPPPSHRPQAYTHAHPTPAGAKAIIPNERYGTVNSLLPTPPSSTRARTPRTPPRHACSASPAPTNDPFELARAAQRKEQLRFDRHAREVAQLGKTANAALAALAGAVAAPRAVRHLPTRATATQKAAPAPTHPTAAAFTRVRLAPSPAPDFQHSLQVDASARSSLMDKALYEKRLAPHVRLQSGGTVQVAVRFVGVEGDVIRRVKFVVVSNLARGGSTPSLVLGRDALAALGATMYPCEDARQVALALRGDEHVRIILHRR